MPYEQVLVSVRSGRKRVGRAIGQRNFKRSAMAVTVRGLIA